MRTITGVTDRVTFTEWDTHLSQAPASICAKRADICCGMLDWRELAAAPNSDPRKCVRVAWRRIDPGNASGSGRVLSKEFQKFRSWKRTSDYGTCGCPKRANSPQRPEPRKRDAALALRPPTIDGRCPGAVIPLGFRRLRRRP